MIKSICGVQNYDATIVIYYPSGFIMKASCVAIVAKWFPLAGACRIQVAPNFIHQNRHLIMVFSVTIKGLDEEKREL